MLNVAPQKERIPDHLRAMAEQDDKSAASGKTGEQSSIGVGCAPGEERDSAISICAVHSATVTAAIAEYCEDTVEKQKTLTEVLDGLVDLTTRLASLATARRSAIVAGDRLDSQAAQRGLHRRQGGAPEQPRIQLACLVRHLLQRAAPAYCAPPNGGRPTTIV